MPRCSALIAVCAEAAENHLDRYVLGPQAVEVDGDLELQVRAEGDALGRRIEPPDAHLGPAPAHMRLPVGQQPGVGEAGVAESPPLAGRGQIELGDVLVDHAGRIEAWQQGGDRALGHAHPVARIAHVVA